jgi:hypothetical protein
MMLTIQDAKSLLKQLDIPSIIQQKILYLLLGFGTPSANIIKQECLKLYIINHYNYIENSKTLWRLKIYNNNYKILLYNVSRISIAHFELSIAAVSSFIPSNKETYKCKYKISIEGLTANHLYLMFYNLDKFHYGVYGTPTANIIRRTIV